MAEKYVALSSVNKKINYVVRAYRLEHFKGKIVEALKRVPIEDVAPIIHAHWSNEMVSVQDDFGDFHAGYQCSRCNGIFNKTTFCGGCGARMNEEDSEQDERQRE